MGYYISLGRPIGSKPRRAETMEEVLNRQDWTVLATKFDHDRVDTWFFENGFIELIRKPPKWIAFETPWLVCRVSWGAEDIGCVMDRLLTVGEDLDLCVYGDTPDGDREVTRDNLHQFVRLFQRGHGTVAEMLGEIPDEPA